MSVIHNTSFLYATGHIRYNMTNDYMFRYILQKNKNVLKGLVCSLLHLHPEDVLSLEITNPMNLSEEVHGKEFVLDINIILNNNTSINLEMQVVNKHNWPERSLSYLCRSYDNLYKGHEYEDVMPAIHIGFLDFTLFPEVPEFYATNMLMNVKNHHIFSDKFRLSVVDLSQIELATEEDRAAGIDHWARLFKAKTWREMIELAKKDECFKEAAQSLYEANADEIVRQKCWAREEAERHERTMQRDMGLLKDKIDRMKGEYAFLKDEHDTLKDEHDTLKDEHDTLKDEHDTLKGEHDTLKGEHDTLKDKHNTLKNENNTLKDENDTLKEQLSVLQEQIRLLKKEL